MTVNIVIPVFNRINETKKIISNLRVQNTDEKIKILIIDDGSTDGTSEWLSAQKDLFFLKGNGKLFWGGAINLGINYIIKNHPNDEWILLINNDVEVKKDYVDNLVKIAKKNYPAAVGSIVKNKKNEIVSLGPRIDPLNLEVGEIYKKNLVLENQIVFKDVDALSGRGVIYPLKSIIEAKGLNSKIFPHYYGDYSLSMKINKKGYKLMISLEAIVFTDEDFKYLKEQRKNYTIIRKLFSKKSPSLFYSYFFFWWQVSNFKQRLSLPLRMLILKDNRKRL